MRSRQCAFVQLFVVCPILFCLFIPAEYSLHSFLRNLLSEKKTIFPLPSWFVCILIYKLNLCGSSDFLGTNFVIYDSQPPYIGAKPLSSRGSRRFASKQISPQVPAANFEVGQVSYKFNLLKPRGPRRMVCSMKCPSQGEPAKEWSMENSKTKKPETAASGYTILRNKAPRWHEPLQCWCLNFHGRVTVASVKNFQLVAIADQSQPGGKGDEETVLLQFGKVGNDNFTMDYRQPLSAFQAFAICLTSFGTKLACE